MTNQETYLALGIEKAQPQADDELKNSLTQWTEYLEKTGLAGGQITGSIDTTVIAQMLGELASFPSLTKQEKFALVNLPEITVDPARSTPQSATLCDICLVVPTIREWAQSSEVTRLCETVYRFKRVLSN